MGLDSALFIDDLLFFNCEEIVDSEKKTKDVLTARKCSNVFRGFFYDFTAINDGE